MHFETAALCREERDQFMLEAKSHNSRTGSSVITRMYDYFFGFDFFISYSRRGNKNDIKYAETLYEELTKPKRGYASFRCFLDSAPEGLPAGQDLLARTYTALRQSRAMIVIVTKGSIQSPYVALEVEVFTKTGKPINLVDIDGILDEARSSPDFVKALAAQGATEKLAATLEKPRSLREPANSPLSPSETVIKELQKGFTYTRTLTRRYWGMTVAALLVAFLVVLILGVFLPLVVRVSHQENVARGEAAKQLEVAKQQRDYALSRRLASESWTMVGRDFDLALLLSVEANRVKPTVEARASLFKALQAYPLLDSFGFTAERVDLAWFLHPPGEVSIWANTQGDRIIGGAWGNSATCLDKDLHVIDCEKVDVSKKKSPRGDAAAFRPSAFSVSQDGRAVAFLLDRHRMLVWDEVAGCPLGLISARKGWHGVLSLAPRGKLVVARENDERSALYDVVSGKRIVDCANATFTSEGSQAALLETLGDENRTIILWDVRKGKERGRLTTETAPINIAFSPNGSLLASSGAGNQITVWSMENLEKTLTLVTTSPLVREFAFSPDSTHLAVAGLFDVTLWDLEALDPQVGQPFRPGLRESDVPVGLSVAYCAQGKALAVTACGLPSGNPHFSPQTATYALAVSANRERSFADVPPDQSRSAERKRLTYSRTMPGSPDDCMVVILKVPDMKEICRYKSCGIAAVNSDGTRLGIVDRDRFSVDIRQLIWTNSKPTRNSSIAAKPEAAITCGKVCSLRLPGSQRRIRSVCFASTKDAVFVTDDADSLVKWALPPESLRSVRAANVDEIIDKVLRQRIVDPSQYLEWSPPWKAARFGSGRIASERLLAFSQGEHTMMTLHHGQGAVVTVRDAETFKVRAVKSFVGFQEKPKVTSTTSDGAILASTTGDAHVQILRAGGQGTSSLEFPTRVEFITFTPQDKLIIILNDGSLWTWNNVDRQQQLVGPCEAKSYPVAGVSPDGTRFARATRSPQRPNTIEIFNLSDGSLRSLAWQGIPLGGLIMSPDNRWLAGHSAPAGVLGIGADNTTLWVWDLSTGDSQERPLATGLGRVSSMVWSPDAGTLATLAFSWSGNASSVTLWDVASGKLVGKLPAKQAERIVFSPGGKTLATTGKKGTEFWDVDLASWTTKACRVANRNLTEKEWQQHFHDIPYRKTCPNCPAPEMARELVGRY